MKEKEKVPEGEVSELLVLERRTPDFDYRAILASNHYIGLLISGCGHGTHSIINHKRFLFIRMGN